MKIENLSAKVVKMWCLTREREILSLPWWVRIYYCRELRQIKRYIRVLDAIGHQQVSIDTEDINLMITPTDESLEFK